MEMSGPQLAMRMIGSVGRVDQHELRTGTFKDDDWRRLVDAVGKLNEAQIYIDDTGGLERARAALARAAPAPPVRRAWR